MDADDSELANLPPEEAARKLASQNRLLRTKLRAVYRAEEENTKLRAQVENLAQQLVRSTSGFGSGPDAGAGSGSGSSGRSGSV